MTDAPADRRLVLFTRYPEPGRAKTRLVPALGAEGAAALQRAMAVRVLATLERVAETGRTEVEVRLAGGDPGRAREWLGPERRLLDQGPGDLGARMHRAFEDAALAGIGKTVIVGGDCPAIEASDLADAFLALSETELVLGPAEDGGYWAIGLRDPRPSLFVGIPWGTDTVLAETTRAAAAAGIEPVLLRRLPDVDRPEDLEKLPHELRPRLPG